MTTLVLAYIRHIKGCLHKICNSLQSTI